MTNISPESEKERAWVEDHQHHHHRGEVINADTPSSTELPASIIQSGVTGHEHTAVLVVVGQAAGYISDRLGRRKFLVFLSTALFAAALTLLGAFAILPVKKVR
jgi:hypothetical protein